MDTNWDLSHIYKKEEDFEKDLVYFKEHIIKEAQLFEGKLGEEKSFLGYLSLQKEADMMIERLYMYASLRSDLNKKDIAGQERLSKVIGLFNQLSSACSFAEPELLALGREKIERFLKNNPEFEKEFDFYFDKLFRQQSHVLSAGEEKLLSHFSGLENDGSELYSLLTVADLKAKKAKLSDGAEVEVTMSNWSSLIEDAKTAEDRETIFKTLYSWYDEHKNAYGQIYATVLHAELAEMKARGYSSILEEHLYGNKIPLSVFHNLIEVASTDNSSLKRYIELRRKYLGLTKHRSYDRFLQLAKSEKKYTYTEAKEVFFASIDSFPTDYKEKAKEVTKEGYVDVYPKEGKRSGAYSNGGANIHPYILLNYEGRLDDVFTLAHEAGHSIHTLYSEESQPISKQNYSIFVAEIASTFNEHNLLDYLLRKDDLTKNDKIYLLQKAIDEIVSTFYRQSLFAHYEYEISLLAQKDEPINYQVLSNEMVKLYKQYYGIDILEEEVKPLVWAYIPHLFYSPFYVYQYATSFTASMLIYQRVKKGEKGAMEKHIELLRRGGSEYPVDEVMKAGVDFTDKETFYACPRRMDELVDELEKLLSEN